MISARATSSLDALFKQSILEHGGETFSVTRETEMPVSDEEHSLLVLSISSYLFRIVALFDFAPPARDADAELINMICGAVNRGLSTVFAHAGMSTPYVLESSCAQYLPLLEPDLTLHYAVQSGSSSRFNLAACLCVTSGTTLDFSLDLSAHEDASSGELELF
jgi:hypothetical protein